MSARLVRFLKQHGLATGLLLVCSVLLVTSIHSESPTFDEINHLTGGYSYWVTNDYRLFPQNGKLPMRWAALALLPTDCHFPPLDQQAWEKSNIDEIGHQFFFASGNDPQRMIWLARIAMIPIALLLCWAIYVWSRQLFGVRGGLVSLTLAVFSPGILAHGRLVTSDTSAALGFLGAVALFWSTLHRVSVPRLAISCLVMGALFTTKMSAWWLVPVLLLLVGIRLLTGPPLVVRLRSTRILRSDGAQLAVYAAIIAIHVACVIASIWALYGFRFATFRYARAGIDEMFFGETLETLSGPGIIGQALVTADKWHLLPEAYLFGVAHVLHHSHAHPAFLAGRYSNTGWWYFFPYCFLVKTPIPTLIVLAIALVMACRTYVNSKEQSIQIRLRRACYRLSPLYSLLTVYWLVAISSSLNIGERHILPTYPPMFVLAGAIGCWRPLRYARAAHVALVGLLIWTAVEAIAIHPHFLAYFNELAGGPRRGYRHLVDSSLDWGQDLPELKQWIHEQRKRGETAPIYVSYFGAADPAHYLVDVRFLRGYFDWRRDKTPPELTEGIYCISATILQGLYLEPGGPWTQDYERQYQEMKAAAEENDPQQKNLDKEQRTAALDQFQRLRMAKLLSYLRTREPDDQVGFSILIYRVSQDELSRALE